MTDLGVTCDTVAVRGGRWRAGPRSLRSRRPRGVATATGAARTT